MIDNRLARRFWPNGDAVGKRMYFPADISNIMAKPKEEAMMTIVGVIEPMRLRGLVEAQSQNGAYYSSLRQVPPRTLGLAIRTAQAPESAINAVRRELAQVDPELPFYGVRTLEERVSRSLMDRRTPMLLATGFAALRCPGAIGIYGVLAYQCRSAGARLASAWRSAPLRETSSTWCCAKAAWWLDSARWSESPARFTAADPAGAALRDGRHGSARSGFGGGDVDRRGHDRMRVPARRAAKTDP